MIVSANPSSTPPQVQPPAKMRRGRLTGPVTVAQVAIEARPASVAELCQRFLTDYAATKYRKANGVPTDHEKNMAHAVRALEYTTIALSDRTHATGDVEGSPVRRLYDLDPDDFQNSDLRAAVDVMRAARLSIVTINGRMNRIRQVFGWGVGKGWVKRDVIAGLREVEQLQPGQCDVVVHPPKTAVPDDVFFATASAARREGQHDLVLLMLMQYHTGMRSSEMFQMMATSIDRSRPTWIYEVPRVQANTPADVKGHKSDRRKHRLVALFAPARDLLDGRIQYVMSFAAERPLLMNGRRRWTPNSYRTKIHRICERHGITAWTPHDVRRNFASRMEARYDIHAAQLLLGHSSPRTTDGYVTRDLAAVFSRIESEVA